MIDTAPATVVKVDRVPCEREEEKTEFIDRVLKVGVVPVGDASRVLKDLKEARCLAVKYANAVAAEFYNFKMHGGAKDGDWWHFIDRKTQEFRMLSDAVRSTYYHSEMSKLRSMWKKIVAREVSLPVYKESSLSLRDTGVRFYEKDEGKRKFVRLSVWGKEALASGKKQPEFEIILGSLGVETLKRMGKREMGQLLFVRDLEKVMNDVIAGRLKCTGAKLLLDDDDDNGKLKMAIGVKIPVKYCERTDGAYGLIHVWPVGIYGEERGSSKKHAKFFYHEHSLQDIKKRFEVLEMRKRRLQQRLAQLRVKDWSKYHDLCDKQRKMRDHYCKVAANEVVEWAYRYQLPLHVVYEVGRHDGELEVFPPCQLANLIVSGAQSVGLKADMQPVYANTKRLTKEDWRRAARCWQCQALYKLAKDGMLLCDCKGENANGQKI
jgi:hypothetical protein